MVPAHHFDFGDFRLDADARILFHDQARIQFRPKALDILVALVEKHGVTVTRFSDDLTSEEPCMRIGP